MTARDIALARAVVGVAKLYNVPFIGLAGTCHQTAAQELGVLFIAGPFSFFSSLRYCLSFSNIGRFTEWFADLDYSAEGKLLITQCV